MFPSESPEQNRARKIDPRRTKTTSHAKALQGLGWLIVIAGLFGLGFGGVLVGAVFIAFGRWGNRFTLAWLPLSPGWLAVTAAWLVLMEYAALTQKHFDLVELLQLTLVGLVPAVSVPSTTTRFDGSIANPLRLAKCR